MSDDEHAYVSEDVSASDEENEENDTVEGASEQHNASKTLYNTIVDHRSKDQLHTEQDNAVSYRMTKYEYARVKGVRMEQLQRGSIPFVSYQASDTAETLFRREFVSGSLPLKVERKLPDGRSVYLRIRDFTHRDAAEYHWWPLNAFV